jgi:hypothetical protein
MLYCVCICSAATSALVRGHKKGIKRNFGMYADGVPNLIMHQLAISVNRACKICYMSVLSEGKLYPIVTLCLRS